MSSPRHLDINEDCCLGSCLIELTSRTTLVSRLPTLLLCRSPFKCKREQFGFSLVGAPQALFQNFNDTASCIIMLQLTLHIIPSPFTLLRVLSFCFLYLYKNPRSYSNNLHPVLSCTQPMCSFNSSQKRAFARLYSSPHSLSITL